VRHFQGLKFRWDIDAMNGLPESMHAHYKEPLGLYDKIGNELATKERLYRIAYAKEVVSIVATFYMHPTQFFSPHKPNVLVYV